MKLKRNIVKCLNCGEVLESTHVHDFVQCNCKNETFTDGGTEYIRRGGMDLALLQDESVYEDENGNEVTAAEVRNHIYKDICKEARAAFDKAVIDATRVYDETLAAAYEEYMKTK